MIAEVKCEATDPLQIFHALQVPTNRFVVLIVVLGFPIALVLAWAFELTPEGIQTTKSARERQSAEPQSSQQHRKRNWTAYLVGAAIPTLILHSVISNRSNKILDDVDQYGLKTVNLLTARRRGTLKEDAAADA